MRLAQIPRKAAEFARHEYKELCWKVNRALRDSATISTRQGIYSIRFADKAIAKELYCRGEFELDWISKALGFIRDDLNLLPPKGQGVLVDVGSNIGVIAIGALRENQFRAAIAIEPEPTNFSLLQRNVALNHLSDRVVCIQSAVSDTEAWLTFELSKDNFGDHRVRTSGTACAGQAHELHQESARLSTNVKADSLDQLLSTIPESVTSEIAALWVDIQGFEGHAFRGAQKTLASGIPVVSELWPYGIRRSGISTDEFCEIAASIWDTYYVWRRNSFIGYPIGILSSFIDELDHADCFDNIIFTQ
jgi:FkbM family methyltransferase